MLKIFTTGKGMSDFIVGASAEYPHYAILEMLPCGLMEMLRRENGIAWCTIKA
jgi:hypothetical protein